MRPKQKVLLLVKLHLWLEHLHNILFLKNGFGG